jgi:hypothetical protein
MNLSVEAKVAIAVATRRWNPTVRRQMARDFRQLAGLFVGVVDAGG